MLSCIPTASPEARRSGCRDKYGKTTEDAITQDPYILCEEVWGIGFLKADEIADKVGIRKRAQKRLRAALRYALTKAADGDGTPTFRKRSFSKRRSGFSKWTPRTMTPRRRSPTI